MKKHKKLIEVGLPLPEINDASAYDKMPGVGPHPKGIHHWWARLPLPTARAILFASVVDDPEMHPEKWPTEELQNAERERLFNILRQMMAKKLHDAPEVYAEATREMLRHCDGQLPAVFDPFSGGGSIPLEANRLGFEAHAGDLNPVAVLLNKCNLEIAPRWNASPPVNPADRRKLVGNQSWSGVTGLAADVRYYGERIRESTIAKIGDLYPKASLPIDQGGGATQVVAWMWARTVRSPDPAARGVHVPLITTYWLSSKKGSEAWLEPVVDAKARTFAFKVHNSRPKNKDDVGTGTKIGRGGFKCILTGSPITFDYIRDEGKKGRIGRVLLAAVVEARRGRTYVRATPEHDVAARPQLPADYPITDLPTIALGFRIQNYGIRQHWEMFTERQLVAMVTLSDGIRNIFEEIRSDALSSKMTAPDAHEYSVAVVTFLSLALSRTADYNNAFNRWRVPNPAIMNLFSVQALPMVWDFVEANTVGDAIGSWLVCVSREAACLETIIVNKEAVGSAKQVDAATGATNFTKILVSTDPPYYDNIGYAALSDFFYIWLRRTIGSHFQDIFSTVLVPKAHELTAAPERFDGNRVRAKEHFESGFRSAFSKLRSALDPRFPLTVYYAFKQADDDEQSSGDEEVSIDLTTGWETLLEALISSGFQITGTWPVRASQAWRMRAMGSNALASYIVLACRPRADDAPQIASNQFRNEVKRILPTALRHLQQGNIAPVDFAQAALGPAMAVYSQYSRILESTGSKLSIRAAINIINRTLTEVLSEVEDDFDADTRWAIAWFEQNGFSEGNFGDAELLSKAKVTSVSGLQQAKVVVSKGGKVRLLRPDELSSGWNPHDDRRLTVWETTHQLLRLYHYEGAGDEATSMLLRKVGAAGEAARDLAYRLFQLSEKKKMAQEALGYNALVLGWPEIARLAREERATPSPTQSDMFGRV